MESDRFKMLVTLSCDHAGINRELGFLESDLRKVLGRIEDPRKVRDFLRELQFASREWCVKNNVDMRGWMDNGRYRKA